jgi:hypothetical protein
MVESSKPVTTDTVRSDESIQSSVLKEIDQNGTVADSLDLAKKLGISHTDLDNNLKSLVADEYLELTVIEKKLIELSAEGKTYTEKGTPEY